MFRARHLKRSENFRKGVEKFVHYKRHLLKAEDVAAIKSKVAELRKLEATRAPQDALQPLHDEIEKLCREALPGGAKPPGAVAENIEVFFTAIVIALGIRAFLLQPFKIPTGSMQPTLNGVRATSMAGGEEFPSPPQRAWEWLWNGRRYVEIRAPQDDRIVDMKENPFLLLFVSTKLQMASGDTISVPAPAAVTSQALGVRLGPVKAGQIIVRGWIQGGDQLLVDKMSYHFRRPHRGEVFVFTTKGIIGIERSQSYRPEYGSQHYIKRLVGVPGDRLEITATDELMVNDRRADSFGCDRVMGKQDGYNGYLRQVPTPNGPQPVPITSFTLAPAFYPRFWHEGRVSQPVYFAMGDNQQSSADSRYWGPVPQANLVGPALLVYWPVGNHFGLIR